MLPNALKPGNLIKIPPNHIRETNWPGTVDHTTFEKVVGSNLSATLHIYNPNLVLQKSWTAQAFGYQPTFNVCIDTNMDVISGYFSGCWMASYLRGDQRRVAHVFAIAGGRAKAAFAEHIYGEGAVSCCFKPVWKAPATKCLGIITQNNVGYSLGVNPVSGKPNLFKIEYLERATPQNICPV